MLDGDSCISILALVVSDWKISILVQTTRCSGIQFIIHVDVVRVKSFIDGLCNPAGALVLVAINKLTLVPGWIVSSLRSMT